MMTVSYDDLKKGFLDLGLKQGDMLLVHSSLKSFGFVDGGASGVINAILEIIGEEGTLIVPTLTGKPTDSPLCPPVFDVLQTPCWTGTIPETVRKMQGCKRSLHPTHSAAAIGKHRELITEGHEFSKSPCDKRSPYYLNAMNHGHIMLIGVDQESNTSVHSCEEIAEVPYHLQQDETDIYITDYSGQKIKVTNRLHQWEKPKTDFNKLDSLFKSHSIMTINKIGNSTIRFIDAFEMFDFTIDLLKKNKLFLLERSF